MPTGDRATPGWEHLPGTLASGGTSRTSDIPYSNVSATRLTVLPIPRPINRSGSGGNPHVPQPRDPLLGGQRPPPPVRGLGGLGVALGPRRGRLADRPVVSLVLRAEGHG